MTTSGPRLKVQLEDREQSQPNCRRSRRSIDLAASRAEVDATVVERVDDIASRRMLT